MGGADLRRSGPLIPYDLMICSPIGPTRLPIRAYVRRYKLVFLTTVSYSHNICIYNNGYSCAPVFEEVCSPESKQVCETSYAENCVTADERHCVTVFEERCEPIQRQGVDIVERLFLVTDAPSKIS